MIVFGWTRRGSTFRFFQLFSVDFFLQNPSSLFHHSVLVGFKGFCGDGLVKLGSHYK